MTAHPPWHAEAWRTLLLRLDSGRLPHALLIVGAAGLGKRDFAARLEARLLCQQPAEGEACGRCRACTLLAAGTHPDRIRVTLETNREGKLRSEIVIDQIRALNERLAMTSQFGGRQVALVDPADAMNVAAANALLKTLEEPSPDSVLVLVANQPSRLPATVRSRCQRIELFVPPREQALAWLHAVGVRDAEVALEAAGGNPGLARRWAGDGLLDRRRQVEADLAALAQGRADAYTLSRRWAEDAPSERLWFAAQLAAEEMRRHARDDRRALSKGLDNEALDAWFRRANRARESLRGYLRVDLVLLDLLAAWH
jgi:DNA polymerase-3 subunit delta'